jgi:DNA repair protein RecN (Recombination protein N)
MALKRIVLRDFVIVSELELELQSGFTVFTGETGAGKSILIDALQLVTGARADSSLVREGAQRTEVSAEFDAPASLEPLLSEWGYEAADTLLLRRTVDNQGKSRAWVNGSPATVQQLRQIGEQLLDIHGQHAWQSLTRPEAVRALLDAYAQIPANPLPALWSQWRQAQTALDKALSAQDQLQRERERLSWQIGELTRLNPQPDEWDSLNSSHSRLANGQALLDAAQAATDLLAEGENDALSQLHAALQQLQAQAHLEADFKDPVEALESAMAQVQDVVHTLHAYTRRSEPDPAQLAELDARMTAWVSQARRYKRAPEDLPALLAGWQAELAQLEAAADLEALQQAEQQARNAFMREARSLSALRAKAAPLLAQAITQAMQGLGMQGGKFEVALEQLAEPAQSGLEDVQFLVAGHAGSTPRPVAKVASGGELSRIALAIAVTTSQLGSAQTLIFDEVDSGVGGAVAQTVGRLMRQLGVERQVMAVTHLPQVAACADHHLVVSKHLQGSSTVSTVQAATGDQRAAEVARMLGGAKLSDTTLAHAREMLQAHG